MTCVDVLVPGTVVWTVLILCDRVEDVPIVD